MISSIHCVNIAFNRRMKMVTLTRTCVTGALREYEMREKCVYTTIRGKIKPLEGNIWVAHWIYYIPHTFAGIQAEREDAKLFLERARALMLFRVKCLLCRQCALCAERKHSGREHHTHAVQVNPQDHPPPWISEGESASGHDSLCSLAFCSDGV